MPLEFTEQKFSDLSQLEYQIFTVKSNRVEFQEILVLKFIGHYRIGCQGNPDATFMKAIQEAALASWRADAFVLDLSKLEYEWGDMLEDVFPYGGTLHHHNRDIEAVVVVGPKCRKAVRTLIFGLKDKRTFRHVTWIFEDLTAAMDFVEQALYDENQVNGLREQLAEARYKSKK